MNTLPKEFLEVRNFLREIPHINRGGCAIAALAMYHVGLKLGMNIKVVYFYDFDDQHAYQQNDIAIEKDTGQVTYCNHAGVVVDNHYMDTLTNVVNDIYPYYHVVPESMVLRTLREGAWNPAFDRYKWLPVIESRVGQKLLI